jgi:uncharacterized protein YtpQ (UPF0354 family)
MDTPDTKLEQFAAALSERLAATSALELCERSGTQLHLRAAGHELKLDLKPFYESYAGQPDPVAAVAETLLHTLYNYDEARTRHSFAELRERILPMLKPLRLLATVRERKLPMLVYRPFLADLMITYVVGEPSSLAYLNEQHLERWGVAEHELYATALDNLRRRTEAHGSYTVTGEGATRLIIFKSQDGFDATRLLLPTLLERWQAELPGQLVIGIPDRDFLIIFSDADREVLANVAHQIQLDAAQREHGLTDQLFTLEAGQVRAYDWE